MLEQIVRPFQQSSPVVSRGVVSVRTKLQHEKARLTWGDVGTLPTPEVVSTASSGFSFKVEDCKDGQTESGRKYGDKVRIYQNNDQTSDNYVDWQPISQISFKPDKNNKASGFMKIQFTDFSPSADFSNDFEKLFSCNTTSTTYNLNKP